MKVKNKYNIGDYIWIGKNNPTQHKIEGLSIYINEVYDVRIYYKLRGTPFDIVGYTEDDCFLTKEEIVTATKLVCEAGIDWVKTSTGQYGGPSVQDVMLMVDAVKGTKTKVKVAGVKDPRPQNAFCFIQAGAELIGTRAAVEILDAVDDLRKIGLIPAYTGDK